MAYDPIETFRQEADELLAEIELAALSLDSGEWSDETIHQLFRAFHTIKGSGAMCGFDSVAAFTHHVESLLDKVREGSLPVSAELTKLILDARDHIRILLNSDPAERAVDRPAELVETIHTLLHDPEGVAMAKGQQSWAIVFRPNPSMLCCGTNPAALFAELRSLGSCEIEAHTDSVPSLDVLAPDHCYLWWSILLHGVVEEPAIRDVFIFVEDGSELEIKHIESETAETARRESVRQSSPASGRSEMQRGAVKESTVRVPAQRLDRLVNLVGELVMNQSRLARAASEIQAAEYTTPVEELARLIAELRDNVLSIRMLPIGTLFGRFRRLVHDLSAELGKEAELITEGAETELDKSILDQLAEPMVHCLRNCLDHGIEPPSERTLRGKPGRGQIRLTAAHEGSHVVICIQDDGRGISRAAVRQKAVEKGLIAADADPTEREILDLILQPGFSTAREITSVSGRGVGMDAVKRAIEALRGTLSLASDPGKGTIISLALPLTLAIIDGLLFEVGADQFIVPMAAVTENVDLTESDRNRGNGRNLIAVRGELIPYIDLRESFNIDGQRPEVEKVVIVRQENERFGLVVDRVLGTHQTVIQSLGKFYRRVDVVSGATIMGDGRVALIVDPPAVVRLANRQRPYFSYQNHSQ